MKCRWQHKIVLGKLSREKSKVEVRDINDGQPITVTVISLIEIIKKDSCLFLVG